MRVQRVNATINGRMKAKDNSGAIGVGDPVGFSVGDAVTVAVGVGIGLFEG